MKILHVFNNAGNPMTIAKYQRKLGHTAELIFREEFDRIDTRSFFPDAKVVKGSYRKFLLKLIPYIRKFDLIHIHVGQELIPIIKRFYPKKKIVLTYRGTDIRGKWKENKHFWERADLVTVSTKDLLEGAPEVVEYTPNPVDRDHFKRISPYAKGVALFIYVDRFEKAPMGLELAKKQAEEFNLELAIWNREQATLPYKFFPRLLEMFEYYIDIKINHTGNVTPAMSTSALQALAMGAKVIHLGKLVEKLPTEHEPENVAKNFIRLYESIL